MERSGVEGTEQPSETASVRPSLSVTRWLFVAFLACAATTPLLSGYIDTLRPRLAFEAQVGQPGGRIEVYLNEKFDRPWRFEVSSAAPARFVIDDIPLPLRSIRIDPEKRQQTNTVRFTSLVLAEGSDEAVDLLNGEHARAWKLIDIGGSPAGPMRVSGPESRMILETSEIAKDIRPLPAVLDWLVTALASSTLALGTLSFASLILGLFRDARVAPAARRARAQEHRDNSFDLLRLIAASAVMFGHLHVPLPNFGLGEAYAPLAKFVALGTFAVYVFFGLSGYLICGSLVRDQNFARYAAKRAARIFPGLAGFLLLCILVGALLVTRPLVDYLYSGKMLGFMSNILLFPTGYLPSQELCKGTYDCTWVTPLWSLAFEVAMYALIAVVFAVSRTPQRVRLAVAGMVALSVALYCESYFRGEHVLRLTLGEFQLIKASSLQFAQLMGLFFVGAWLRLDGFALVRKPIVAVIAFAALFASASGHDMLVLNLTIMVAVPVLFVHLGQKRSALNALLARHVGDISYGVYIYHFAVQHIIWVNLLGALGVAGAAVLSVGATLVLAFLSFKFIEKPALTAAGHGAARLAATKAQPNGHVGEGTLVLERV
jgi:peptidoglycan/LPS O-acetylase OafA/YrhL